MDEKAKKLFLENYKNEGDCSELDTFMKKLDKGFGSITYLPWATVERIFTLQGGTWKVAASLFNVPVSSVEKKIDGETGEIVFEETSKNNFFTIIQGNWMGRELTEEYPIFDNKGRAISNPDAMDINNAKQRGLVKLIARISGIGLRIFETGDLQFGDEEEKKTVKIEQKVSVEEAPAKTTKNTKTKKEPSKPNIVVEEANVEDVELPTEPKNALSALASLIAGDDINEEEPKVEVKKEVKKPVETPKPVKDEPSFAKDSEEYANKILLIRQTLATLNAKGKTLKAKELLTARGFELLKDFETYEQLEEYHAAILKL